MYTYTPILLDLCRLNTYIYECTDVYAYAHAKRSIQMHNLMRRRMAKEFLGASAISSSLMLISQQAPVLLQIEELGTPTDLLLPSY